MQGHTFAFETVPTPSDHFAHTRVKGICKGYMADNAVFEEGERPDTLGAIDDLVRHDKVPGLDVLLQAASRTEGDDAAHSNRAERGNVCPSRNFVRCELVMETMPREECDGNRFACVGRRMLRDGNGR